MPLKKSTTTGQIASVHTCNRRQQDPLLCSKMVAGLGGEGSDGHEVADRPSRDHSSFSKLSFTWNTFSIPWIWGVFSCSMRKWKEFWDLSFFSFLSYKHEETALSKKAAKLGQPWDISSLNFWLFFSVLCGFLLSHLMKIALSIATLHRDMADLGFFLKQYCLSWNWTESPTPFYSHSSVTPVLAGSPDGMWWHVRTP